MRHCINHPQHDMNLSACPFCIEDRMQDIFDDANSKITPGGVRASYEFLIEQLSAERAAHEETKAKLKELQEQKPVAYSIGNTLHWHEGQGRTNAELYAYPIDVEALQQRLAEQQAWMASHLCKRCANGEPRTRLAKSNGKGFVWVHYWENARQSGDGRVEKGCGASALYEHGAAELESMLQQARKEENEACQQLCDEISEKHYAAFRKGHGGERGNPYYDGKSNGAAECMEAIRARMK